MSRRGCSSRRCGATPPDGEALGVIHAKVEIYARHLAVGTADQLWRDGPECD
jgi:hypothetical protein